ncbi:putative ribonuclease ZC3H12C [Phytophthora citrophthora]|uniref:Ribonuclease ZC3H12C n=1 Tax=Phytophthora citrophthora TaxID=4793 RepID=A0AAD9GDW8_9STRA|nr:putative ribonuclease ZC3H12C [Phytophthora citrophthora]
MLKGNSQGMMYRPKQRAASSVAAPTRLLDRRGDHEALLVSTEKTKSAVYRTKSPNSRHNNSPKILYRSMQTDTNNRKTPPPLPVTAPPVPNPPRPPVEDVRVLLQKLKACEKQVKSCKENQDEAEAARTALRCTCVELINAYPRTAKTQTVNERLWRSWYREIEAQTPSVLKNCSSFYSKLVDQLQNSLRRPNRLPGHLEGLNHSLQQSLVALGDVARYEQNIVPKDEQHDWSSAQKYYQQALEVAPSSGKVYNQLGLLAVLEGKLLQGAYLYARSLVCERSFASSGNLLHILHRGKSAEKQLQTQQETSSESETYSARVLACMHMILSTNTTAAEWNGAVERTRTALLHLLDACDQQDTSKPIDGPMLEVLSKTLTQTACLSIVLACGAVHTNKNAPDCQMIGADVEKLTGSELTKKALTIGHATASSLLMKLTTVLSSSAESTRTKYFANALLPALNIYVEWLHESNLFSKALQGRCVDLFQVLSANGFIARGLCCAQRGKNNLSDASLPEDRELSGFLPYENVLLARFPEKSAVEKRVSQPLSEEELLVLRTTRFMASSEKFVFAGGPPALVTSASDGGSRVYCTSKSSKPKTPSKPAKEVTSADPLAINPVVTGRLCILCSNTSTFPDGECEFCGYEDEVDTTDDGKGSVSNPSWIQDYDLAYNNINGSPQKSSSSGLLRSPPARRSPTSSASSTPVSSPQSESPVSPQQTIDTDFKTIMCIGSENTDFQDSLTAGKDQQHLIVIDAPNVAMRHGKGKVFSCAGIELAIRYFQELGHRVVAFIPDYMLQSDEERAEREEQGEILTAAKIPDDVALLERLMHKGVLVPTPPQDYDDSYSIQYAGLHDGYVVTNDLFRDHIVNMVGPRERKVAMRAWLRAHQISYSWVKNEFLPNPNFR